MNREERKRVKRERLWRQLRGLYELLENDQGAAEDLGAEATRSEGGGAEQQSLSECLGNTEALRRLAQRQAAGRP